MTEIEADVADYLDGHPQKQVSVRDVLIYGLRLDPDKNDYAERAARLNRQVAAAMERAGWRKVGRVGRGENRRTV
jgi:hypothetical protein